MLKRLQISHAIILTLIIISSIINSKSFHVSRNISTAIQSSDVNLYLQKVKMEIIFTWRKDSVNIDGSPMHLTFLVILHLDKVEFFLNLATRRYVRPSWSVNPSLFHVDPARHTIALLRQPLSGLTRYGTNGR